MLLGFIRAFVHLILPTRRPLFRYLKSISPNYKNLDVIEVGSGDSEKNFSAKHIFENSKIRDQNKDKISMKMKDTNSQTDKKVTKTWEIPACYNEYFALDMKIIQKLHQITKEEVINLHSSVRYYTYYIGFMPGFPYLGDVPSQLITPRLATPRVKIPARSIGIAKNHTCIYPKVSPGGWNIIGQIPFDIFDLQCPKPSLFLPGDEVKFFSISLPEFQKIKKHNFSLNELIKEYSS